MRQIPIPCEPEEQKIFCPICGREPFYFVYRRKDDGEIIGCDLCIEEEEREVLLE